MISPGEIVIIDPAASMRDIVGSTLARVDMPRPPLVVYVAEPERPKLPDIRDLLLPIPGKIASRGDVTHKKFAQMNRAERRAFLSKKHR